MALQALVRTIGAKLLAFQHSDTKFVWILLALSLLIILNPLLPSVGFGQYVVTLLFSFIVLSGILAASDERQVIRQLMVIGLITLVLDWIESFATENYVGLSVIIGALYALFLAIVTIITVIEVTKSKRVTGNIICGAIAAYLLIGLTAAILAGLMETIHPGSFLRGGEQLAPERVFDDLLYYSMVTLSTIGYGDITPNVAIAQSLSIALGLLGQIYLTVLVAMLVGKFLQD